MADARLVYALRYQRTRQRETKKGDNKRDLEPGVQTRLC